MRTPKSYIENLEQGIVTEKMLCDVLYSYNKRAKNWRDKKREYKHSYASHSYVWYNSALENEKKYYECKSELLDLLEPKCIHEEILENDYETIIQYYLFFEIGDHSFHQPIEKQDIPQYPNLDIVRIEQLMTHGQTADNLLSCQFADKVREKLLNGEAVIVKNIEELKTKSKDEKLL